jgi:hypoxanthine phosphoribosyltransferase
VHDDIDRILLDEARIISGIDSIAAELTELYRNVDLTVVAVLKGSCVFVADLIRRIPVPLQLAFACAESYRQGTEPGTLDLRLLPHGEEVAGQYVLLVDDILDSGRTMEAIQKELFDRGALDVKTCAFLDKPVRRQVDIRADFRCFEIEDVFAVGYGLDFAGKYRNLPYVGALRPEVFNASLSGGA